jgi:predicted TIM-barrel fold metal-dependent hydrolase
MIKQARGIDSHAHIFSADAPAVKGARYRPAYAATLDAWRAAWNDAGITHGVLVQPSFFGTDNAEMLAAVARDRDHLRAVAVVDPAFGREALARLSGAGAIALRFNLHAIDNVWPFFEGAWRDLLHRARAVGWHLEVFATAGAAPAIAQALASIDIAVVFDHFAAPGPTSGARTFEALARLARTRNVWCKLSAPYRIAPVDAAGAAAKCIEAVGEGRVVWGSDWPFTRHEDASTYATLRASLDQWAGASAPRILWDNAARLYRFD